MPGTRALARRSNAWHPRLSQKIERLAPERSNDFGDASECLTPDLSQKIERLAPKHFNDFGDAIERLAPERFNTRA